MKLHILSDLHLSVAAFEPPATDADVVILAGDLARPEEVMAWADRFSRPVLFVPGNHEFYGGSLASTVHKLRQACKRPDHHVLDSDAVVIDGVRFLGATLWTDFQLFPEGELRERSIREASTFMRDFSRIRINDDTDALFTPAACAAEFQRQADWLEARLAEPFAGHTVVITHHAPSRRSIHPRFDGALLNACFVSDAEYLFDAGRVDLWIHGHTHNSFDYRMGATRVVCNPRGYTRDGVWENPDFNPDFTVELAGGSMFDRHLADAAHED